jgi:hypothetical protein
MRDSGGVEKPKKWKFHTLPCASFNSTIVRPRTWKCIFQELRDDQVIYLNPTPAMTSARALAITRGRRLVIVEEPNKK